MPRRPRGAELPDRQHCDRRGCERRLTSEDPRVTFTFTDRGSYPGKTRKLGQMHPDCFAFTIGGAWAEELVRIAADPSRAENLLGDSRPPARSSSSPDAPPDSPHGSFVDDAAKPPAPRPRPPGSGSGTT